MFVRYNNALVNISQNLIRTNKRIDKTRERLVSGNKIKTISDDAAGLLISEKLKTHIRGLTQVDENVQNAVSLIQTADKALDSIQFITQKMRELAVQAANDTNSSTDRQSIQDEINELTLEINKISLYTEFNTLKIFDKNTNLGILNFQTGSNSNQGINMHINDISSLQLGLSSDIENQVVSVSSNGSTFNIVYTDNNNKITENNKTEYPIDISTHENATSAIFAYEKAISLVSLERTKLGSYSNRFSHSLHYSDATIDNLEKEELFIREIDIGKELINLSKNSMLQQVAQSIFAQANQSPQNTIKLLTPD